MTVNKVCHHTWNDIVIHVCGRTAGHGDWHQCPCGAAQMLPLIERKRARRDGVVPAPAVGRVFDDGEGLRYSVHAAERRAQMNVRHHEVRQALDHPELQYPADNRTPGGTCYQAGRIVVITTSDGRIVTILWHRAEGRDEQGQPVL